MRETIQEQAKHVGRKIIYYGSIALLGTLTACSTGAAARTPAVETVPTPPTPANGGYTEIVQQSTVNAFSEYGNASRIEVQLKAGDAITASCIIYDPTGSGINVPSTDGLWYRLAKGSRAGSIVLPQTMYVATNTEDNGPNPANNNAYDPQVPVCSDSPDKTLPSPTNPHNLTPAPTFDTYFLEKPSAAELMQYRNPVG